ncbi:DUF1850 domain-containing protein [Acinetobacter equi]|uniref:DUF1850 domain-containing protein n=1 Tax=Acinetobacter equi TaxID=1324350 RepID=A0A0N9V8H3_9GAMM|nr:DUF1850 domain-containing protein [Acinetobacter equi]ALH95433.1 hypothetical protein AOY20_07735 [Acinetobacter equi]
MIKHKSVVITTLLFGLCFGLTFLLPVSYTQVQVNQNICKIPSQSFDLQWKHSVEKTNWLEHYQIKNNNFVLQYTDFISFGAGTPISNLIIFQKDGWIRMEVNQMLKEINWTISKNMQGVIKFNHQEWRIYEDYPNYSLINISIQQQPFWTVLWLGECL